MRADRDPPAPRLVVLLHVLTFVVFVASAIVLGNTGHNDQIVGLFVGFAALPYLVVAVLLWRGPGPFAYGAALMLVFLSMFVIVGLTLVSMIAGPVLGLGSVPFVAIQIGIFAWVVRRMWQRRGAGVVAMALGAVVVFFWPLASFGLAMVVWGSMLGLSVGTIVHREERMNRAVVHVQRCLLDYRATAGGFPRTLDELPRGDGGCLREDDLEPGGGTTIRYMPGAEVDGRIASFRVFGETRGFGEFRGTSTIATETGLVARGVGSPIPLDDAEFLTDRIPDGLEQLRRCIVALSSDGVPPMQLRAGMAEHLPADLCASHRIDRLVDEADRSFSEGESGYRLTYLPDARDFRLEARPVTWGATALRSYLMHAGRVWYTIEDRPARETDIALPPCLPEFTGDCVSTPVEAAPRAVFVHDSVAYADRPFPVRAGVVGAPDRRPRITARFECEAGTTEIAPDIAHDTVPGRLQPEVCHWNAHEVRPPLGDRMILRMWMGKGGRWWAVTDTVPFVNPYRVAEPIDTDSTGKQLRRREPDDLPTGAAGR